jgi:hypothetical protein
MTLIPATACLATILSFNNSCDKGTFEREKAFYWRSTCAASGETLRWYDAASIFEDAKSIMFDWEEVVCESSGELVIIARRPKI